MKSKNSILLKTLVKSTSQLNVYKYSRDKKKRGRVIGNAIGFGILHILLIAYCIATTIGYGQIGLIDAAPMLCALTISMLALVLTFFKTNGYLFSFKEYDMLMSLPFAPKSIAACKFLYMYCYSLPWYSEISLSIMVVYGVYNKPDVFVYPLWILLTLFIPIIPMLVASFFGFLIIKVSSGFRNKNIIQTVLVFVLVIAAFMLQVILPQMFKENKASDVLLSMADKVDEIGKLYWPAKWFSNAITALRIADILLLVGVTIICFEVVMFVVGRSYRRINSALKSHTAAKDYELSALKKKNVIKTIVYKEYKRMLGSSVYLINASIGEILSVILGIAVLIAGFDKIIYVITKGAPINVNMLFPAIPLIVYFLIGMVATTTMSPSLEGKNYWIVQSLPIEKKVLYQGKMLFNMYFTVPPMLFATLCICISAKVPFISTLLYILLGFVLCAFSTAWGMVCGIKHMRLDWENEIEVVKQGAAVAIYMFPNMFITMGLVVGVVFLGTKINADIIVLVLLAIEAILTALSYHKVISLANKEK